LLSQTAFPLRWVRRTVRFHGTATLGAVPAAFAALGLSALALAVPNPARGSDVETGQVRGTMEESLDKTGTNAYGTASGDLAGPNRVKFISETTGGDTVTVLSRRTIDTEEGTLVLDEVGTVDLTTLEVSVVSTVAGGNGIFAGATGVLYLTGQIDEVDGTATLTYTGTIDLED
jgi:hypothetical protein